MWEARPKVGAINVQLLLPRNVDVLAAGTVHLHPTGGQLFAHSDRQHVLPLAQDARARAEVPKHELLLHHGQAPRRQNKASVDQAVEVHCRLVDLQEVLVVEVVAVRRLRVQQHVHSLVEMLDFLAQAVKVEVVADVLLVDLAEEFVALQVAEPGNPAVARLAVVVIVQVVCK